MFYSLATEEMDHISRLHTAVVDEIEEYKEKKGEPPVEMMALYHYLHEKHIDHATKIKTMLEMYDTRPTKSNNSTEIRDYIKTYKKDIYKTFNMLIF